MTERLYVDLPGERLDSVNDAVANGDYDSPSEVVDDALKLWEEARRQKAIEELRRLVQHGIDSGFGQWKGAEAIIAEAKRRRDLDA